MSANVRVRTCLIHEAPKLLDFWNDSAAGESATDDMTSVAILFRSREDAVLIAEIDGEWVGCVIAAFDGWRGNIYRLGVSPAHRNKGIGRLLVREAERRLVAHGAKRLVALASSHSPTAAPFWDSMASDGWRPSHPGARYAKTVERVPNPRVPS